MKYFISTFLFVLLIGCSHESQNQTDEKMNSNEMIYGHQLLESGFLDFADTLKRDSMKTELIESFNIYNEDNYKIIHVDAEELAEFNFASFLPQLNKMLERRKFKLIVKKADDYEKSNSILINGERIRLYTNEELENGSFLESAAKIFFKEINKQLKVHNVAELFYLLYGGNDLHVLLLTTNQHKIIAEKYKNEIKEIPYLP